MNDILVREYQTEDKENIIALILPIQQQEFGIPITREDQPDLSDITTYYQKANGNFWVAVCNGQVVGTVALIDIGNNEVALRKMFVSKPYRGSVHCTANHLLQTVFNWAETYGITSIYLGTTAKFLAAHRFYEKKGFVKKDRETLPPSFPVMKVDTIFYQWSAE